MKLNQVKPLNEAMEQSDIMKDVDVAGKFIVKEVQKMFPKKDWVINAGAWKALGTSFVVDFHEKEYQNNIIQNSDFRIHLMMHLANSRGEYIAMSNFEFEKLTFGTKVSNAGVTYRKIKGKSPMDAAKKVVAWFKKNEKKIKGADQPSPEVLIKKLLKRLPIPKEDKKLKKIEHTLTYRDADALNMNIGDKIILQDLSNDNLIALAKANYIM